MKTVDMVGKRFGAWLVTGVSPGKQKVTAVCDCGVIRSGLYGPNLQEGKSISCGCVGKEKRRQAATTHGMSGSKLFWLWCGMLSRCEHSNNKAFKHYGGRGITVCERWHSFENFYADMGDRPSEAHSLERVNNEGPYGKDNCVWALAGRQSRNTRRTVRIDVGGGEMVCLKDLCAATGVNYLTFRSRCEKRGITYQQGFDAGLLNQTDMRRREHRNKYERPL